MTDTCKTLAQKEFVPSKAGDAPLHGEALKHLLYQLGHDWEVVKGHHLEKKFTFPDFATALAFTNKVGALAEEQNHHPDIHLSWGKVRVVLYTHTIKGLAEGDFVMAAKIEGLNQ